MVLARARRRFIRSSPRSGTRLGLLSVAITMGWWGGLARADVIVLRGGGQVQGKVVPDPQNKDRVQVWLLQGRKPLSFLKAQIEEVIPKAGPLDGYFDKARKADQTVTSQYDLGTWCDENKLPDLAKIHYETAVAIDKSFEPAHKKLGHVFHDGYWLSRDDLSAVQGLVKYKGRWVSTEEKAKKQAEEEASASQTSWVRRIRILQKAIVGGTDVRQREAVKQLMAIREPEAVGPLLRVLGNAEPDERILLAQVLAGIPGKEATAGLVKQILAEPDATVRPVIFEKLKERDDPAVVTQLTKALASADIQVVNRAAWTIGNLGAVEVVPRLIPALLSFEQRVVLVPKGGTPQPTYGFSSMGGSPVGYGGPSFAVQTPPVVSAGAVAYGIVGVPVFAPSLGLGNVGAQINNQPEYGLATFTYRNVEVLAALEKMTGQNFGYDLDSWRHWVSREFNPTPKPPRRVLQP